MKSGDGCWEERPMFTLNLDIEGEGIHQGSNDSGHVFRTFNNRIFIILNTCGILYSEGNLFYTRTMEGQL